MRRVSILLSIILFFLFPVAILAGEKQGTMTIYDKEEDDYYPPGQITDENSDIENSEDAPDNLTDCLTAAYGAESARSTLYGFISPENLPDNLISYKIGIPGQDSFAASSSSDYKTPKRYGEYVKENGLSVQYLFLIDCSTSMPAYAQDIKKYIRSIAERNENKDVDAVYTVAGCGTKMEVIGQQDLTDLNKLMEVLDGIRYGQEGTDFYTGLISAVKYLRNRSLVPGSLTNLILITDGVPFLEDEADAARLAELARSRIVSTPEILFHTLCLNEWKDSAEQYIGVGKGYQAVLSLARTNEMERTEEELKPAAKSGKKTADFINNLYLCTADASGLGARQFPLQLEYKFPGKYEGVGGLELERTGWSNILEQVRMLSVSVGGTSGNEKEPEDSQDKTRAVDIPSAKETDTSTESSDSSTASTAGNAGIDAEISAEEPPETIKPGFGATASGSTAVSAAQTDSTGQGNSIITNQGTEGETGHTSEARKSNANRQNPVPLPAVILFCVALLAVVAAMILKKAEAARKEKNRSISSKPERQYPLPEKETCIPIRLEIISGNYIGSQFSFRLKDQLVAGSDPSSCDLVFEQDDVSSRHLRIFLRNDLICIEDLGSFTGTFLGGVRLQSASRLRSGDEIRIGEAGFILWF